MEIWKGPDSEEILYAMSKSRFYSKNTTKPLITGSKLGGDENVILKNIQKIIT